jgi:hypothetical protein
MRLWQVSHGKMPWLPPPVLVSHFSSDMPVGLTPWFAVRGPETLDISGLM